MIWGETTGTHILENYRTGAKQNRKDALREIKNQAGKDRDEYPPAMFKEGGSGASVRHMQPRDNQASGASIGGQC